MNVQLIDNVAFTKESKTYELKLDSIKGKSEKEIIMICVYCILQSNETLMIPPYTLFDKKNLLNALIIIQTTSSDGIKLTLQTKPEFEIFILQIKNFITSSYLKPTLTYLATSEETFFEVEKVIGTKYSVDKVIFKRPFYLGGKDETTGEYDSDDYRERALHNDDIVIQEVFYSTKDKDSRENIIVFTI